MKDPAADVLAATLKAFADVPWQAEDLRVRLEPSRRASA